jgi:copper chaperone CopZ
MSYTTAYKIDGVFSGHCRAIVTKALQELEGVTEVHFDLAVGQAEVTSRTAPDERAVAAKVEDAGYDFLGRA